MQSLTYSSLNAKQRARVAYLFADHVFGTDARAFAYEWDGQDIQGRKAVTSNQSPVTRRARTISAKVTMLQEVNITDDLIFTARRNMDALAASIARKLQQSQIQEVSHE